MSEKCLRAVEALEKTGSHTMTVGGNSMMPLIKDKSSLTYAKTDDYQVGDVVLTKVKGRWIEAHLITKMDASGRYLISNNKGHDNGWTRKIYGRVVAVNGNPFGRPVG